MYGDRQGAGNAASCDQVEKERETRELRSLLHDQTNAKINLGGAGYGAGEPARVLPLRERVERAIVDGERAQRRAHLAYRVKVILDQHPEFGELLDLMHEF